MLCDIKTLNCLTVWNHQAIPLLVASYQDQGGGVSNPQKQKTKNFGMKFLQPCKEKVTK